MQSSSTNIRTVWSSRSPSRRGSFVSQKTLAIRIMCNKIWKKKNNTDKNTNDAFLFLSFLLYYYYYLQRWCLWVYYYLSDYYSMCAPAYGFDHPISSLPIGQNCCEPFRWKRTRNTTVGTRTRSWHFAAGDTFCPCLCFRHALWRSRTTMTQTSLVTWSQLLLRQGPSIRHYRRKWKRGNLSCRAVKSLELVIEILVNVKILKQMLALDRRIAAIGSWGARMGRIPAIR